VGPLAIFYFYAKKIGYFASNFDENQVFPGQKRVIFVKIKFFPSKKASLSLKKSSL